MSTKQNDIKIDAIDYLVEALTAGWVKPSILVKIWNYIKLKKTPAKFLELSPEQLKTKYSQEKLLKFTIADKFFELPQSILYDYSELNIPLDNIKLIIDTERPEYIVSSTIKSKYSELKKVQQILQSKHDYDSTTIRVNDIIIKEKEKEIDLIISKTHYIDYLATNFSMDAKLKGWRTSLREQVHPKNTLCTLKDSVLANHFGIGVLLFTSDGFLVLPLRSKHYVNIRSEELCSAISGASEFDRDKINGLIELLNSILREGSEELGIEVSDLDLSSFNLLGITRELLRGGKPEFFFNGHLNCSKEELIFKHRNAKDKEYSKLYFFEFKYALNSPLNQRESIDYNWSLLNDFRDCIKDYGKNMSLPLLTNIILWLKYKLSHTI